jgi:hypothetical protein
MLFRRVHGGPGQAGTVIAAILALVVSILAFLAAGVTASYSCTPT